MKNSELIMINGIKPPLHLKNEPGKYTGFLIRVKETILTELNTGKTLEVKMPCNIKAEQLLKDLIEINVNNDNAFILKVENNILIVNKYFTIKTGI